MWNTWHEGLWWPQNPTAKPGRFVATGGPGNQAQPEKVVKIVSCCWASQDPLGLWGLRSTHNVSAKYLLIRIEKKHIFICISCFITWLVPVEWYHAPASRNTLGPQRQKGKYRAGNYIPQILWEVITHSCPRYLLLALGSAHTHDFDGTDNWTLRLRSRICDWYNVGEYRHNVCPDVRDHIRFATATTTQSKG